MTFCSQNGSSLSLIGALAKLGLIPSECIGFRLEAQVNAPMKIYSEAYATDAQVEAITAALQENPEAARCIVREVMVRSPFSGHIAKVELPCERILEENRIERE